MSSTQRVRQILSSLDSGSRAELKKLLPSKLGVPDVTTEKYPSMLLSCLGKEQGYSLLGFVAEHLLQKTASDITLDALFPVVRALCPLSAEFEEKIRKSKTTQPFLDSLVVTRNALEALFRPTDGSLVYEPCLHYGSVEGHPDMMNTTQVFEVKLTGLLNDNWVDFLLQVFAYGALSPTVTDVYLVLPLQKMVWHSDIRSWANRTKYRDFLVAKSTANQTTGFENQLRAQILCVEHGIGWHVKKQKSVELTLMHIPDSRPYQIFLSGPQNSHMNLKPEDLASGKKILETRKLNIFVHSQYIINLCAKDVKDEWHTKLLQKNLEATRAFGGKGVVVHVGKSTDQPMEQALENMRKAILACLPFATEECPLLLETPAGQGTETLRGMNEFLDFVDSFKDKRLRMCLDTCHVFACKHDPLAYLYKTLSRPGLLKLVHYNDSLGTCGSCVDRHALVGSGHIGFEKMSAVAEFCSEHGIPMVIE
jgi:deoxyribonuclease IV